MPHNLLFSFIYDSEGPCPRMALTKLNVNFFFISFPQIGEIAIHLLPQLIKYHRMLLIGVTSWLNRDKYK